MRKKKRKKDELAKERDCVIEVVDVLIGEKEWLLCIERKESAAKNWNGYEEITK